MIVHILPKSATFKGVRYNTNKTENGKGELLKVSGFGPLQGFSQLKPEDYVNYLNLVSSRSKRTKYPQLHAVISAKGKSSGREELTELATNWLKEMGYERQPYLIVFHKDTKNNHVHIVSTRVDKDSGRKISSAYEKIRAVNNLNKIMGLEEKIKAEKDLAKALSYKFSTKAQFMMALESKGYILKEVDKKMQLIKFGHVQLDVDLQVVKNSMQADGFNQKRRIQLTAILHKYRKIHSAALREETISMPGGGKVPTAGFTSDLAVHLREKLGLELKFHGKPAYGYTIIDHDEENIFKGGEIVKLEELTEPLVIEQVIMEQSLDVIDVPSVVDSKVFVIQVLDAIAEPLGKSTKNESPEFGMNSSAAFPGDDFQAHEAPIDISISDDIDDEAILGRNRHRKKQARTNTR
jgi:hypothetical protein